VKTEFPSKAVAEITPSSHRLGPKAIYLEPLLILGSFVLWLTVLPFAALLWSGATLFKRVLTLLDGAGAGRAVAALVTDSTKMRERPSAADNLSSALF